MGKLEGHTLPPVSPQFRQEKIMSRKIALVLAAVASLGATALAPTSASAFGHSMGHVSMSRGPVSHGPVRSFSHAQTFRTSIRPMGHYQKGPHFVKGPHHFERFRHFEHFRHEHHEHFAHHYPVWWCKHHHHHYCGSYPVSYPTSYPTTYPTSYETPVATTYAPQPVASTPVAKDTCTCLTKSYLPDGSVLFKDVCTKEMALATADEVKAQAEGTPAAPEAK
jgi:hypothetical protein